MKYLLLIAALALTACDSDDNSYLPAEQPINETVSPVGIPVEQPEPQLVIPLVTVTEHAYDTEWVVAPNGRRPEPTVKVTAIIQCYAIGAHGFDIIIDGVVVAVKGSCYYRHSFYRYGGSTHQPDIQVRAWDNAGREYLSATGVWNTP